MKKNIALVILFIICTYKAFAGDLLGMICIIRKTKRKHLFKRSDKTRKTKRTLEKRPFSSVFAQNKPLTFNC